MIFLTNKVKDKNILIVVNSDTGGAGTTIYRMFKGMKQLGYNVKLLVNNKYHDESDILTLTTEISILYRIKRYFKKNKYLFTKKLKTDINYYFFNTNEKWSTYSAKTINGQINFIPDVIIGTWISGFVNYEVIGKLAKSYNARPYILMNDMAHLTGGCHYNWGCNGYLENCDNCPAIVEHQFKNIAKINLRDKNESIKKHKIKLIAGSDQTKKNAQKSILYRTQKDIYIYHGLIDFDIFNSSKREFAKAVFQINNFSKVIFCGALDFNEKRKGYKELKQVLYAFSRTKTAENQDFQILIAGNLPDDLKDIKLNFKAIPFIKDPILLSLAYQASDLFLSTSIEDCGPMMVAEALSCGTPVIGFDIGLVSSLINDGYNGYKINCFDLTEMAVKVEEILSLEQFSLADNCIESVKEKYSLKSLDNLTSVL